MKLKGLTKLALSGVALAAVAATLGTSTYAWYVSNSTATVAGLDGATAESNSGNLLLAQLANSSGTINETGNWGNKLTEVSLKTENSLNPTSKDAQGLTPVEKTDAQTGKKTNTPTGWHDRDLNAMSNAYNYYAFGIMSTEMTKINMTFGIENNTAANAYNPQTCYSSAGTGSIGVNNDFYVDLVSALRVEVLQVELPENGIALTSIDTDTNTQGVFNTTNFKNIAQTGAYNGVKNAPGTTALTGGNAHEYYAAVAGEDPAAGVTEIAGTTLTGGTKQLTVTANTKYVLMFRVWIEGTDTDCFDSIGGQTYQIGLSFEAVNS